jgi:hypothetical protein
LRVALYVADDSSSAAPFARPQKPKRTGRAPQCVSVSATS